MFADYLDWLHAFFPQLDNARASMLDEAARCGFVCLFMFTRDHVPTAFVCEGLDAPLYCQMNRARPGDKAYSFINRMMAFDVKLLC